MRFCSTLVELVGTLVTAYGLLYAYGRARGCESNSGTGGPGFAASHGTQPCMLRQLSPARAP